MAVGIKNYARMGFGLGLGVFASQVLFILLGMALFIPGLLLFNRTKKENDTSSTTYYGGIVLMVLGVVLMGGIGAGFLFDALSN
jgi:uncharacterized membrane protein YidH (DUF202 family)